MKQIKKTQQFYSLTSEEALVALNSQMQGLSGEEAARRLEQFGANELSEQKRDGIGMIFLRQFKSPLIYTLLISAGLVLAMGEALDASIIAAVLIINAVLGSVQEGKARAALAALRKLAKGQATVLRSGETVVVNDEEVVAGDVLVLREGDQAAADGRILESRGLMIDESMLTGESLPVAKHTEKITGGNLPPQDQLNMIFKGTMVAKGGGFVLVVAIGTDTLMGGISKALMEVDHEIPLQFKIRRLSGRLILFVIAITIILFIVGVARGLGISEMFAASVALAVSIVPEGLPVAVTVILASGVWRMSRRNALVRKLAAVEALAHAEILAVDKTGTITKNELVVKTVWTPEAAFQVQGQGFEPKGDVLFGGQPEVPGARPTLARLGEIAALVGDAEIAFDSKEKRWRVIAGDPTDAAILVLAEKLGFRRETVVDGGELLETVPFDYQRKFHAAVYKIQNRFIFASAGSVESIAALCDMEPNMKRKISLATHSLARQGLRAIGLAGKISSRPEFGKSANNSEPEMPKLVFLGILGMADQLHEAVPMSVALLRQSGIRTVMLTGDTPQTGQAIAKQAGIYQAGDNVITGEQLKKITAVELNEVLDKISVFARVTPQDKLDIIRAYGRGGKVVAMTGDGVNDAPALLAADLGIAMGRRGTAVAREAADIVLLDDNFATIVAAAEEGRGIYRTIQKVLIYLFSTSVAELVAVGGVIILGLGLPITGGQIVWLNFVTDGFLTVALGVEPTEKLGQRLRLSERRTGLLGRSEIGRILWLGSVMGVVALYVYLSTRSQGLVYSSSMTLTFLAVVQWLNAWNCHSNESLLKTNLLRNRWLIYATIATVVLHILAIHWQPLQKLLHVQDLSLSDWVFVVTLGLAVIVADEVWKLVRRHFVAT